MSHNPSLELVLELQEPHCDNNIMTKTITKIILNIFFISINAPVSKYSQITFLHFLAIEHKVPLTQIR